MQVDDFDWFLDVQQFAAGAKDTYSEGQLAQLVPLWFLVDLQELKNQH